MPSLHVILLLAASLLGVVLVIAHQRATAIERRGHIALLADQGWTIEDRLPPTRRREAFEPFAHARVFPRRHHGLLARFSLDGLTVIESRHTQSSGKHSRTIHILAAHAQCPTTWPRLALTRENLLHKIASALGSRDIQLDDPDFNARWRVRCDDETFAVLLLNPDAQRAIMRDDTPGESWWIESGNLVCARQVRMNAESVLAISERVRELLHAAPPELALYTPDGRTLHLS